jgi:hypothetical protein
MLKKIVFVLFILASVGVFAETQSGKTEKNTAPTPTEKAAQIIEGKTSPYPDIINRTEKPSVKHFVRPGAEKALD